MLVSAQKEIEHTRHEVQQGRQRKQNLSADPLHGAELDIVGVRREIELEDRDFLNAHVNPQEQKTETNAYRKHVIRSSLGVA